MSDSSRREPILDRSRFTSPAAGRDLKNYSIVSALEYDGYGAKLRFSVAVLSKPIPISSKDAAAVLGSDGTIEADDDIGQITFMGRIDDGDVLYGPHMPLPDPGQLEYGSNPQIVALIIGMHCQFISNAGYSGKIPAVGDLVTVTMDYGDFSYDLQYAEFDELQTSFQTTDINREDRYESLRTKFNNYSPEKGASVGEITLRTRSGAPTKFKGSKGETRKINFASIKHTAACTPANQSSDDFKTYLGASAFDRWRKELVKHEAGSYSTVNTAGYLGLYQFGIQALETVGYLKSGTHASMGSCKGQSVGCISVTDGILNNSSNWTGKDGVNSKADYLANKNGCQEKALNGLASGNLASLRSRALIDASNPNDVGGMVAASHLRGVGIAGSMRNGTEVADGYGTFPSKYYINMGGAVC